jgi:hypothetical protein
VLALVALALGLLWAVRTGQLRSAAAVAGVALVIVVDLWSIERKFVDFQPHVSITYADDEVTTFLQQRPQPHRVLDGGVYIGSWLMAHHIPSLLGYHGNQIRYADELLGGKNQFWPNAGSPTILSLYGVQHIIVSQVIEARGWEQVLGPVPTASGRPGVVYANSVNPTWARVLPAAAKIPENQIIPTVLDPRFPADRIVLFPDTMNVNPAAIGDTIPELPPVQATVSEWRPGRMRIALSGQAAEPTWLLVSENWYPDWRATIDGQPATVRRGQFALITVELPPGAREVVLEFRSRTYARGRMITLISLAAVAGLFLVPVIRRRKPADD